VLRGAGVRAAVIVPKADDRPASRTGVNAHASASSPPTGAGAGDARAGEEMERRWQELGSRLLASHPPKVTAAPVSAPSPVSPSAKAPSPADGARALVRDSTRPPLAVTPPPAPALAPSSRARPALSVASTPAARRDAPFLGTPASSEPRRPIATTRPEPKHDDPGVVIERLEVTVAAPPPPPPPAAPPRARAEARGGAFSLATRRYLTRI
jgi:hypothetical protein